jgi:hypothetical protein
MHPYVKSAGLTGGTQCSEQFVIRSSLALRLTFSMCCSRINEQDLNNVLGVGYTPIFKRGFHCTDIYLY